MAARVLVQAAVSFLLGIVAARYGRWRGYALCGGWLLAVGWMALCCCERKRACPQGRERQGESRQGNPLSGRNCRTAADAPRQGNPLSRRNCRTAAEPLRRGKGWLLPAALRVAVCLALCAVGSARYESQQETIEAVEQYLAEESHVTVAGTLHKKEEKDQRVSYYLKDSYIICETGALPSGQVLIYSETDDFSIGDTITVTGTGECFEEARNQGNFDSRAYYHSKEVFFRVWAEELTLVKRPAFLWREALYRLRKDMQQVFAKMLPEEAAGVLGVMTLGEKELLSAEVKELYQQSGISHALSISGLHVSVLGAGVYQFLRRRGLSYLWAGTIAGALVFCFGVLSGMELSAARAVVMYAVMLAGNVLGMAYDSVTALAFSALLQLWDNPLCLWYAGFVLSYGAVLAMVVAVRTLEQVFLEKTRETETERGRSREKKRRREAQLARGKSLKGRLLRWKRELKSTFFVSTCIQLAVLPLTVYYYFEFPLYTVIINGLLLPFMGPILMSGILGGLAGVLGGLWGGPAGAVLEGLAFLLLRPAYLLLEWNKQICSLFGRLPGAMQITGQPGTGALFAYFAVLALALWLLSRRRGPGDKSREAGDARKPGPVTRGMLGFWPLGLVLFSLLLLVFYRPDPGLLVCFLDVGQGDGIYIRAEHGGSFFLDGGSTSESQVGEYRILSFLKCRGVRRVEGWFVSHADEDHISGLKEVWESGYPVERLFLSQFIPRDEAWEELCRLARAYETEIVYLGPGDVVGSGELSFTCLYPRQEGAERNDASMALYMDSPHLTAFFGGDLSTKTERELAQGYDRGPVDLYKAIHHGSDGSNSAALLELLRPRVSVVSCAAENSYGHPGKYAVERMEAQGSLMFYTMEGGQITVGADKKGIWVEEFVEKEE